MQPDCLKGRVVCETIIGDMHLKDLLGSMVRVGYRIPVSDFYLVLHGLQIAALKALQWINQSLINVPCNSCRHIATVPARRKSGVPPTTFTCAVRVYSDRTRQRHNGGVKHNALDLEHILVNRSIQTGSVASKNVYNRDAVDLTLARPV